MHTRKKPCNGCNEYVTSDFVMYTGESEGCSDTSNKTRLTDVLGKIISFIKKRIVRVTSSSLVVTANSLNCDKGVKIELQPSVQPGNKLVLGSDGKPYVPNDSSTISELQDTELVFTKPITFEGQVSAEDIAVSGGIEAAFFMVNRSGLQTIVPVFRQEYSSNDVYYFNDFVSYQGKLWYYHNNTPTSGNTPEQGSFWTLIVDRGPQGPAGIAGADGISPDYTEFRFAINQDPLNPPAVAYTNPNPTGWTKTPPVPDIGDVLWMIIGRKKGSNGNMIGQWVGPINTKGVQGDPGNDGSPGATGPAGPAGAPGNDGTYGQNGQDGKDIELRYAKNGSATTPPTLNKNVAAPPGWTLEHPAASDLEYIWVITGYKKAGVLIGQWSNPVRFTGLAGKDGAQGVGGKSPFKQIVFKRTASVDSPPSTPTGGSWSNPLPTSGGWTDGLPGGSGVIWASSRFFTNDGTPPQQSDWSAPQVYGGTVPDTDGSILTPVYKGSTVIINPGLPSSTPINWKFIDCTGHDLSECMNPEDAVWLAVAYYDKNGFMSIPWVKWQIKYEASSGGGGGENPPVPAPRGKFVPVFIRSSSLPATPVGGTYANPKPTGWELSPPTGTGKLYMSTRWFTQDEVDQTNWTVPIEVSSSSVFQVKFSHEDVPGAPNTYPEKWHDPGVETGHSESVFDKWMATRIIQDGTPTGWTVVKFGGGGAGAGTVGPPGPALTFRGVWNGLINNYYGGGTLSEIVEYPEYSNQYWRTRVDMGNQFIPAGTVPQVGGPYWEPFEVFHDSIATGLLFAKSALVKNLIVSYLRTGPSPARIVSGTFIPGEPGTEHIEIYPNLSTLVEYRGRGDDGFTGLAGPVGDDLLHLRNLANSIIIYDRYDQGLRTKTEVDKVQLLKIQAVDAYTIPSYETKNEKGEAITIPARPMPGSSLIYQRVKSAPVGGIVYESYLSPTQFNMVRDGVTKVSITGDFNYFKGTTEFEKLRISNNFYTPKIVSPSIITQHLQLQGTIAIQTYGGASVPVITSPGMVRVGGEIFIGIDPSLYYNPTAPDNLWPLPIGNFDTGTPRNNFILIIQNVSDSVIYVRPFDYTKYLFYINGALQTGPSANIKFTINPNNFLLLTGVFVDNTNVKYYANS